MTTACTASKPQPIVYSNTTSSSSTSNKKSNGWTHHDNADGYHDDDDEEEDEQGASQLFSPPPLSWFLQDEQQQQHLNSSAAVADAHIHNSSTSNHSAPAPAADSNLVLPFSTSPLSFSQPPLLHADTATNTSTYYNQQQQQQHVHNPTNTHTTTLTPFYYHARIAAPQQAPSWQEVSCRVLPAAAKELISTCLRRMVDTAHRGYVQTKWTRKYSDLGNNAVGYYHFAPTNNNNNNNNSMMMLQMDHNNNDNTDSNNNNHNDDTMQQVLSSLELPPFSSLPWIDRQLVAEWRTFDFSTNPIHPSTTTNTNSTTTTPSQQQQPSFPQPVRQNSSKNKSFSTLMVQQEDDDDDDDDDLNSFDKARALVPKPLPRPTWQCAEYCHVCSKPFGPTRLRHHCRLCGNSYCQVHSSARHALPHLGYDPDVPERVCDGCKGHLLHLNHVERVAWRLARCRDLDQGQLTPYFETGVDTLEQAAWRVAKATISMVKSFPLVTCVLGTSATVAVETLDVLRQYGLSGIYGILLRREFLAAADLLRRALGINRTSWPLSVHELTAAIFYALAQHRAMRGLHPDQEHVLHSYRTQEQQQQQQQQQQQRNGTEKDPSTDATTRLRGDSDEDIDVLNHSPPRYHPNGTRLSPPTANSKDNPDATTSFTPVCDPVSDELLGSLLWYAPLALKFIYAAREVDIQLLAAQQGWRLLYAHLEPEQLSHYDGDGTPTAAATAVPPTDDGTSGGGAFWEAKLVSDRPATAMLVHQQAKVACLVIRGTTTIQDVVTDIRQTPIPFPTEAPSPTVNLHNPKATDNGGGGVASSSKQPSFENGDIDNDDDDEEEDWTSIFRGQGLAVCGMANAALNLFRDHVDVLVFWAQKGYRIRITGHSLGGGVAALLGVLLLRHLEELQLVPPSSNDDLGADQDLLRIYAYGTPSCVDGVLSDKVKPFVTTVVLHDDVVPRLTPTSIRGLLKHLLFIRETWVKAHMPDDIFAITERAKTAWAPRWRGSFTLRGSTPSSIQRYCRKQIRKGTRKLISVKGKLAVAMTQSGRHHHHHHPKQHATSLHIPNDDLETISETSSSGLQKKQNSLLQDRRSSTTNSSVDGDSLVLPAVEESGSGHDESSSEPAPRLLLDYMGGIDNRTKGIVIDGDEFFDTERSLLLEEDEESSEVEGESEWQNHLEQPPTLPPVHEILISHDNWHVNGQANSPLNGVTERKVKANDPNGNDETETDNDDNLNEDGSPAVVLEELPLPRMYLPGQVVHIYAHRGVFRAAVVPRNFRDLRRISMAGNMLSDHTSQAYYNALLEVQTVRDAPEAPPRWAAFDEDDTCACCASLFTWASTSDSKAQEARDKHNCRSCGSLVCDPCSQNRIPLSSIGITVPSRVCDRCYNDTKSPMLTQSGLFATARTTHVDLWKKPVGFHPWSRKFVAPEDNPKPERQRERRSAVVDELASRIPFAATAVSVSNSTNSAMS